jgi:hypothetical protein
MAQKSKFVEERINKLLVVQKETLGNGDFKSPILKKLHDQNENVRKLREMFENGQMVSSESPSSNSPMEHTHR